MAQTLEFAIMNTSNKLGHVGTFSGLACALHCMAMPFIIGILPAIGLGFLAQSWFEMSVIGVAVTCSLASLCWGFRKHRNWQIFPLLLAAVLWFTMGMQHDRHHVAEMLVGGTCMAVSNFWNRRLCKSCGHCNHG